MNTAIDKLAFIGVTVGYNRKHCLGQSLLLRVLNFCEVLVTAGTLSYKYC